MSNIGWGLEPLFENMPPELTREKRWVVWRAKVMDDGRVAKQPVQRNGSMAAVNKPHTWMSFKDAARAYEEGGFSGVGFVMTGIHKDITILDFDKCYSDEEGPDAWAWDIAQHAGYVEVSPSGRGLRAVVMSDCGAFINHERGLEVYTQESGRFVTFTGQVLEGFETVGQHTSKGLLEALDKVRPEVGEYTEEPVQDDDEDIERICVELCQRDPEMIGYKPWLDLGMALHHQFEGEYRGLEIWHKASAELPNYEASELDGKWHGFGKGAGREITLRTIFDMAKAQGIRIKPTSKPASAEDFPDLDDDEVLEGFESVPDDPEPADEASHIPTLLDLAHTPPPKQLIEDLIARGQTSQVSGEPGAGKTFFAMEMAYAVATGQKVFGHRVKPAPVLYLAYEGLSAMAQRVRAWRALGRQLPSNFHVLPGKGHEIPPLTDPQAWMNWLLPVYMDLKPGLIVVDTLAAATPGMSTSDEERVGALVMTLRGLVAKTKCHMMHIHHPPKGGALTGQKSRGSGVIEGDLDTQFWVSKGEGSARTVECSKQRSLGSFGWHKQFILKTIATGMETEFGPESAPYLDVDVKAEDSYAADLVELEQAMRDKLIECGNTDLNQGQYNSVMGAWVAEHHGEESFAMQKHHRKRAKQHLFKHFEVAENGAHQVVKLALNGENGE